MTERAREFLHEWTLKRDPAKIGRAEAEAVAERWEGEAAENGITAAELREAAGGPLADYLLRTYGEFDIEL